MTLVLGVDSSTQSTKALLVEAATGEVVAQRHVPHPDGTEVDPGAWTAAVDEATDGLADRAAAVSVAGQQHGLVALGADDEPVRDALLWNDVRSAASARDLVVELGGADACAALVGSVLVASFTAAKLRWVRDHEPDVARRVDAVLLPHDHVSRHLAEPGTAPFTDRGDASGTGYFSTVQGRWLPHLAAAAIGHEVRLPRIVEHGQVAARTRHGAVLAPGTGDNMAAALGVQLAPGDLLLSVGTSGVASLVSDVPAADGTGSVTGFCDATGRYLPMSVTLNAARILDLQCRWLGLTHEELSTLALTAPAGAHGVTVLPYYGGERTPDRPHAVGTWSGLRDSTTRADLARAAYEAVACSLTTALRALTAHLGVEPRRVVLVGGASRSPALRQVLPGVLGRPVEVAPAGEHVALGAARQAAWALTGDDEPPSWTTGARTEVDADPTPEVMERHVALAEATRDWDEPPAD